MAAVMVTRSPTRMGDAAESHQPMQLPLVVDRGDGREDSDYVQPLQDFARRQLTGS
jgi:hypothetical protein